MMLPVDRIVFYVVFVISVIVLSSRYWYDFTKSIILQTRNTPSTAPWGFKEVTPEKPVTNEKTDGVNIGEKQKEVDNTELPVNNSTVMAINTAGTNNTNSDSASRNDNSTDASPDEDAEKPCWRSCPTRPNKIFLQLEMAGLNDRIYIFRNVAQLAAYFCATLHVSSPSYLLDGFRHNHRQSVSPDLDWKDFFDIVALQDGKPLLIQEGMGAFVYNKSSREQLVPEIVDRLANPVDWKLLARQKEDVAPQLEMIDDFTTLQLTGNVTNSFIWGIRPTYYAWRVAWKRFQENKSQKLEDPTPLPIEDYLSLGSCQYVEIKPSILTREILDNVKRHVRPGVTGQFTKVGRLQIRRGDAIKQCNTSIPQMVLYLECSLQGATEQRERTPLLLLMTSDEVDPCYRQSISNISSQLDVPLVDLDAIMAHALKQYIATDPEKLSKLDNNFFVFWVENTMDFDFQLIKRRGAQCPNCQLVSKQLKEDWKGTVTDLDAIQIELNYKRCKDKVRQ